MIEELEKALGIEQGLLAKAVAGEEVTFDLASVHIQSKAEYDTYISNLNKEITEGKDKFQKEGQTTGIEIAVKNFRKKLGLEFEGKTIENLLKAYSEKLKVDLAIDPNQQIESLTKDITTLKELAEKNDLLIADKDKEILGVREEYKQKDNLNITNKEFSKGFELYGKDKTHYSNRILTNQFASDVSTRVENGVVVYLDENGEVLKDKILNPITTKEMQEKWMIDNDAIIKPTGGRGEGGNEGKGGKYTYESFVKSQANEGNREDSEKFNANLRVATDNDLIEFG